MLPGRELTIDWLLKALLTAAMAPHRAVVPRRPGRAPVLPLAAEPLPLRRGGPGGAAAHPGQLRQSTVTERVEDRLSSLAQQVLSRTQLETVITEFNLYPGGAPEAPDGGRVRADDQARARSSRCERAGRSRRDPAVDAFRISFDYEDPRDRRRTSWRSWPSFFIDTNAQGARLAGRPDERVPRGAAGRRARAASRRRRRSSRPSASATRGACRRRCRPTCRRSRTRSSRCRRWWSRWRGTGIAS